MIIVNQNTQMANLVKKLHYTYLPDKSNVAVSRTYILTYCALQKLCKVTQYTFVNIHECVTNIQEKFISVQNVHSF